MAAGVRCTSVRYNSTIHDFMMLNALRETAAATVAITQAIEVLRQALKSKPCQGETHE
jgi:acetyl esterase/lipase